MNKYINANKLQERIKKRAIPEPWKAVMYEMVEDVKNKEYVYCPYCGAYMSEE